MEVIINTSKKTEFIDITDKINAAVKKYKNGKHSGFCIVYVPHATAAVMVNEYEPNIVQDYETFYINLVNITKKEKRRDEKKEVYKHNIIDNNAESHLLASLIGPSKQFIIDNGQLVLGTWQSIILCEFDGPRRRRIVIEIF